MSGLSLRVVGAVVALSALGAPAYADTGSGTVTATVSVAPPLVRSVTISPTTTTFDSCVDSAGSASTGLTFPNGTCTTPASGTPITVTNGQAAGHIDIAATDAVPSDNGQHWTLCGYTGTACAGGTDHPGADQYQLEVLPALYLVTEPPAGPTASCDNAFDEAGNAPAQGCAASAGQSAGEHLKLFGPSSSTDPATSWQTSVTWSAVP